MRVGRNVRYGGVILFARKATLSHIGAREMHEERGISIGPAGAVGNLKARGTDSPVGAGYFDDAMVTRPH